ncbi:hypothetical protein KAJ27_18755 [bacterium]|nr:hypothetical protein [bacterium]
MIERSSQLLKLISVTSKSRLNMMLRNILFVIIIPGILLGRVWLSSAGTLVVNENIFNTFELAELAELTNKEAALSYKTTVVTSTYHEFTRPDFVSSIAYKSKSNQNLVLYYNLNSSLIIPLTIYISIKGSANLYIKDLYIVGIRYHKILNATEYGFNVGIGKYIKNKFIPFYFIINSENLNQGGWDGKHAQWYGHYYSKLNYEIGITFKPVHISYSGYYVFNHADYLEKSLKKNYLIIKFKLPKYKNKNEKWSVNFFIGNAYNIDCHNERSTFGEIIKNNIKGISIAF